jgi:hypothetical protein
MQQQEARRSPRIAYQASVQLLAEEDTLEISGHAVDLGTGGIGIASSRALPPGAAVTCRLTLDGRSASLPGHVAWGRGHTDGSADEGAAHDLGICFEPLPGYEAEVLRHIVQQSDAGYRAVELTFAGLERPVVARARPHTHGLRLSAVLPILARGTELSFKLDEEGPLFKGHVAAAAIHDEGGMRRLDVEVEIANQDSVRFRRHAHYGIAAEPLADEPAAGTPAPAAAPQADPAARAALAAPASRAHATRSRRLLEWVLAAFVGAAVSWAVMRNAPERPERKQPKAAADHTPPVVTRTGAAPEVRVDESAARIGLSPVDPGPEQAHAAGLRNGAQPAQVATGDAKPEPGAAALPEVRVSAGITRLGLPFSGSLEGLRSQIWAQPYTLAVDVPNGRTPLPSGRYPIAQGGISELRLNTRGAQSLLRIRLSSPLKRYAFSVQDGTLEIQLEPRTPIDPGDT